MNFRLIRVSLRKRDIREKSQAQRQCVEILHDCFVSHLKGSRVAKSKYRKTPDRHSFLCTRQNLSIKNIFSRKRVICPFHHASFPTVCSSRAPPATNMSPCWSTVLRNSLGDEGIAGTSVRARLMEKGLYGERS
jgi:hypothetical protein